MSGENMTFPNTVLDFLEKYSFKDKEQVYTNGADLIPAFRVKQMIEHYFPRIVLCKDCKLRNTESCAISFWELNTGKLFSKESDNGFCNYGKGENHEISCSR